MATTENTTDASIRNAAIAHGWIDAAIIQQTENERFALPETQGEWLCLSVKLHCDDDWQLLGRRRTRGELLGLLRPKAPAAPSS